MSIFKKIKSVYVDTNILLLNTTLALDSTSKNMDRMCKVRAANSAIKSKGLEQYLSVYLLSQDIKKDPMKFLSISSTIQLLKIKRIGYKKTIIEDVPVDLLFTAIAYIQSK